jgi:hypothetical protein
VKLLQSNKNFSFYFPSFGEKKNAGIESKPKEKHFSDSSNLKFLKRNRIGKVLFFESSFVGLKSSWERREKKNCKHSYRKSKSTRMKKKNEFKIDNKSLMHKNVKPASNRFIERFDIDLILHFPTSLPRRPLQQYQVKEPTTNRPKPLSDEFSNEFTSSSENYNNNNRWAFAFASSASSLH